MDNALDGVNFKMAEKMGLADLQPLQGPVVDGKWCGVVGTLPAPMPAEAFIRMLKERFGVASVRANELLRREVCRVALCGGAGSFLLGDAIAAGADAIMASHPHIIQPLVIKDGVPVCYSMGNFLFPDFYMVPPRPVWYPNKSEDLSHIPEVESYIFPVERPVLRRWEPFSRYGRAVGLTIEGSKITAKSIITHLSLDNIVSHGELESGMRYQLWKETFKINSNLFKTMLMGLRKAKKKLVSK